MKIIRYFIGHYDQDFGVRGWLPLWIPKAAEFNSFSTVGCMHDALEHRLCDQGYYHEEVMAFGRMAVLRGLNDIHSGRGTAYSVPESMGLELSGIWLRADMPTVPIAPETAPVDDYFERFLETMMHYYAKGGRAEYQFQDKYAKKDPFNKTHLKSIKSWLRIGYLDGVRRYGNPDHKAMDIANTAWRWAKEHKYLDQIAEEYDDGNVVMRILVDTEPCQVKHSFIYPNEEYGMYPQWLRSRIWDWRNNQIKPISMGQFNDTTAHHYRH